MKVPHQILDSLDDTRQNFEWLQHTAVFAAAQHQMDASFNWSIGSTLSAITTGHNNQALGQGALAANTSGNAAVAIGYRALATNTSGDGNTAVGYQALAANTTGGDGVAVGYQALSANTTGEHNTGLGTNTLEANTTGQDNVAVGTDALQLSNSSNNVAVGSAALAKATGASNTAVGSGALFNDVAGAFNTVVGVNAGAGIVSGTACTIIGGFAGNTDGTTTTTDNTGMTLIGWQAQATTPNVIVLGSAITADRPNMIFGGIGAATKFGGGVGVFHIANAVTNPGSNPVGGGVLYVNAGALTYRGSGGTVTVLGAA